MITITNPENGATIKDFHIKEGGFSDDIYLPVGQSVDLPNEAAEALLKVFGFLTAAPKVALPTPSIPEVEEVIPEVVRATIAEEVKPKPAAPKVENKNKK